jgi:predicted acetyltransferase
MTIAARVRRATSTKRAGRRERFREYLRQLDDQAAGRNLPKGKTAQATFWLLQHRSVIVGVSRLRPELNDDLRIEGGNIGYDVPPSQGRRGFGTELLRRVLEKARERGLQRVLVTCNKDNIASRKIIEANGGVLASEGISPKNGKPVLRFWIGEPERQS